MKKIKLLIPALGTVAALSAVAPAVSCGTPKEDDKKTYKVELDESCKDYFTLSVSKIEEGHDLFLTIIPNEGYGFNTSFAPVVKIGTTEVDVSETTIRGVTKTQIAIEAEKINGNISIAVKQQILSLVKYESVTSIYKTTSVSVDHIEGKEYLDESDLEQDVEHTFTFTANYYDQKINLYVRKLEFFDTQTGQTINLNLVDPSKETLAANEYTYYLEEGIYTDFKTIRIGAGTFTKNKSYTLKATLDAAYATKQNIITLDEHAESTRETTEGGVDNGIELRIRENFSNEWSFAQYDGTNYSAWLYYFNYETGEEDTVYLTIKDVAVDNDNKTATINLSYSSLWTIWLYEDYDLYINSTTENTGGK